MAFPKGGVMLPKPTSMTSPSPHRVYTGYSSSTGETVNSGGITRSIRREISDKQASKAIEGLLRSWRTVGKTRVLAQDIAQSLSLSLDQVERVASSIHGVKIGQ